MKKPKIVAQFRIEEKTYSKLQERAELEERSVGSLIRIAVNRFLGGDCNARKKRAKPTA